MKTIKSYTCPCGEDVYEDDTFKNGGDFLMCVGCGRTVHKDKLKEREVAEITKETLPLEDPQNQNLAEALTETEE